MSVYAGFHASVGQHDVLIMAFASGPLMQVGINSGTSLSECQLSKQCERRSFGEHCEGFLAVNSVIPQSARQLVAVDELETLGAGKDPGNHWARTFQRWVEHAQDPEPKNVIVN